MCQLVAWVVGFGPKPPNLEPETQQFYTSSLKTRNPAPCIVLPTNHRYEIAVLSFFPIEP